jgi:hypothetical protein
MYASINGFLQAQWDADELPTLSTRPEMEPPPVRETMAAALTGLASAQLSLKHNKRLYKVLIEQGDSAKEVLDRDLPAAVVEEWDSLPTESEGMSKVRGRFSQRVARRLERAGNEQNRLARSGKLSLRLEEACRT